MTSPFPQNPQLMPYFYVLSRLMLKAAGAKTKEELIFLITNDTLHLLPYQRALLLSFEEGKPKIIGISGQTGVNESAPLVKKIEQLISELINPKEEAILGPKSFTLENSWIDYQKQTPSGVLWLPIFSKNQQILGLWLEQMETSTFALPVQGIAVLLTNFLTHAYGMAWERLSSRYSIKSWVSASLKNRLWLYVPLLAALAFIPVPLRITAPCEIISSAPYLVRAPLNGVIKEILVLPGQPVKKETPLFVYDTAVPLSSLKAAKEDVEEKKLELDRAALLGMQNKQSLNDLNLLQIKLQKEKITLALADYEASLLTVKSPQDGVVILDSPDDWRGHPVTLGEKIMVVSDPKSTRIKIWIPESDNVPLDISKPIKVYLNIFPLKSFPSQIEFISNETTLSDHDIPSYVAKADWIGSPPADVQLGLKGTAILYGESVPLAYYIIRKPWFTFRNFIGF